MKTSFLKAFTLVEMIIVIMVLAILASLGIARLSTIGADKFGAESCLNTLYGPLSEWVYYASSSKILSWELSPDFYLIKKEGQNSGYRLTYTVDGQEEMYESKQLSQIPYCQKGRRYLVKADFNFDRIVLRPSLHSYWDQRGFEIFSWMTSLATGSIGLDFCPWSSVNDCIDFGEILFDARTAQIRKRFCKLYYVKDANYPNREKTCRERSTGN